MTEKEKNFDMLFKSLGGRIDDSLRIPGSVIDVAQKIFNGVLKNVQSAYPNMPFVHIDLIYSEDINASATKYENDYYIGFTAGMVLVVYDLFNKMLATPGTLPSIGDIKNETSIKKELNIGLSPTGIKFQENDSSRPKDKTRFSCASFFNQLVLGYVLFHELGHIIRGHVDYVMDIKNRSFWLEMSNEKVGNGISNLDSQTLEMDADSFATNRSFIHFSNCIANYEKMAEEFQFFYKGWDSVVEYWIFALYSFFRLFNLRDTMDYYSMSHPAPNIRMALISSNMSTFFVIKKYDAVAQEIVKKAIESSKAAENAFLEITYQENRYPTIEYAYTKDGTKIVSDIVNNWNNVRPLLEPFAIGKLPPLLDIPFP